MRRSFARRVGVLVTVTAALWTLGPDARGSFRGGSPSLAAPSPISPDALLENQWHLKDRTLEPGGANVRDAWPLSEGAGVVIGIVDDGVQYTHPDLAPNYLSSLSWDFNSNDADPQPFSTAGHGTAIAGLAAARGDNTIGVAGAAPLASLAALRLTSVVATDSQEASAFGFQPNSIHILNNSWNPTDNGTTLKGPGPLAAAALQSAAATGRNGKGRIFVWSSGNGRLLGDDCNFDGYANSRYAIAVGASTDAAVQVSTSEGCSALMVLAPAGGGLRALTTADLIGTPGYDTTDYTGLFGTTLTGGMNAAPPTVSGAVALMLSRNSNLTWRDVQHILRQTSVRILPTDAGWTTGTFPHNERLGFGLLDATAAVNMAGSWVNVPAEQVLAPSTKNVNQAIPDINSNGISDTITISSSEANFVIEHIEVDFNATHSWRGDLQVKLTSPSGVVSTLAPMRPTDNGDNFTNWKFQSVRHWGQTAAGAWTLNVADKRFQDTGTWNNWTLRIYGYHSTSSAPGGFNKSTPATGATGQPTSPTLSWTASSGATGYEYCFDTTNDNACGTWINAGANTSVSLSGLAAGATYYWQVRASNTFGVTYAQGSSTAFWSFSTGAPPGTFGLSSPANGATGQSMSPTLNWTASSGATSYEYCKDTSNNSACDGGWISVGGSTSAALSGLTAGTTYYWHVRALNATGAMTYAGGSPTTFWSFTTVGAPGGFSHASPANGATGQSATPTLAWGASGGATGYEYCYDTTNDGACSGWTSTGASTSTALSGLTAGSTYYWQVRATNTAGTTYAEGSASAYWSFATLPAPGTFGHSSPSNGATGQTLSPTLTWSASAGAASYEYCYDTSNNSACNASWIPVGSATSVGLSGLTGGTPYYWQVRAINAAGTTYAEGNASAFWSFNTLALPGAFGHSSPSNGATGQSLAPTLTWSASSGATGYEYCFDATNDNACSVWTSTGTNTSVGLSGLNAGTTYYWQARANNGGGTTYADGAATTFWSFTTIGPPAAFTHSSPANNATGLSVNPTLTWSPSAGATSYEYCFDTVNDSACSGGWTNNGTNTSVNLSGLPIGTQYFWQVRATNGGGTTYADGAATSYWSFTTLAVPGAFNRLSPSNGAMGQPLNPSLTWAASTAAAGYEYCIDTTNDGACANWISTGTNTSVGLNLNAGTEYFWQVRATNASGTTYGAGGSTNFWSFTTLALPGNFNHLSPSNGATGQSLNPTLSWSSSVGAVSYQYCVDTTNDSACSGWTSTGTNTSVGLSGLTAGTTYYWHARATNASGTTHADGGATAFWSFTTQVNPPAAFGHNSPGNGATGLANSLTLSWSASSGAASFEYCIDTTNNNACDSTWTTTGTNTSVALSGLATGTAHYWQVRAINPGGTTYAEGAATSYWTFTTLVAVPGAFNRTTPANGAAGQMLDLTLSWGVSAGATNYEYCIDTTNDGACANWISTGSSTSVGLIELAAGTVYFWQVRATNVAGTTYSAGGSTNFWSFTTHPLPGAFNLSSPSNGATGQSLNPTLLWGASTNAVSFEYCIDTTNDGACSGWTSTGTNTSVGLSGLTAGTTYFWNVRAKSAVGTTYAGGGATTFWSFTTQLGAPAAFSHTSPANGATGQSANLTLSWSASAGATGYEYCIDTTNNNACGGWTSTGTNTSVALSGLAAGTAHYWHVRATNSGGTTYADGAATTFWSFTTQVGAPGAFSHTSPANGATGQSSSPTLSWGASAGATSFEYCVDTTNDGACSGWTSTGTNTSVALSGLTAGTAHYWHVRANNAGGTTYAEGAATTFWSFTTQVGAPGAFSHTSPANGATGQSSSPTLSWGASAGATSFEYCVDTTNDGACSGWTSTGTNTSVALSGLAAGTPHYWHVRANNAGGTTYAEGAAATFWSFTTQVGAPAAFSHTSPANGATGQSANLTLSWSASAGATGYEYCIDTTNNNACGGWTSTGTNTSVALSGLAAGTAHYWHVRATNSGGTTYADGAATTFWSFTTQVGAPGAFSHTSPANGATGQSSSPTLSWGASAGATSFEYCVDTTNDGACSGWTSTGTNTSVALSGLAAGTAHYWHVRANNAGGTTYAEGAATTFWNFTTQVGAPAAFVHSTPANGATAQSSSPTLSWTSSAGAASYQYCIDTTNDNACSPWTSTGTNTSVGLAGLTAGTTHFWHVRATNAGGTTYADGAATSFWSFTTQVAAPGAFAKTSPATGVGNLANSPTLSWTASTGATSYEYCIDVVNNGTCDATWTTTGTNTSVGLSGKSAGITYYWQARSINAAGTTFANGAESAFWSFSMKAKIRTLVDLDGNGSGDVFTYNPESGAWTRQVSMPGGGFSQNHGAWAAGWTTLPASFNDDDLTDFFIFSPTTGEWFKMINTGTGFSAQATSAWWPGWQKFVTDLDGDGISDLFLYDPVGGQWYQSLSTPTGFTYTTGFWNPGWEVTPMSLNGDERGDLFLIERTTGRWFWVVSEADGSFTYPQMSYWQPDWAIYPGDFNGDGRSDLFLYRAQAGEHYVAINTGEGFSYTSGAGWVAGWTPLVMDLNADGKADLFLYNKTNGLWFELEGNGAGQFTTVGQGAWTPGWDISPTDFNDDGRADLVLYKPGTGEWFQAWNYNTGVFTYFGAQWQAGLNVIGFAPIKW